MGWTETYKPKGQSMTDFFINHGTLRWSNSEPFEYKVLDAAFLRMSTYYAAVEELNTDTGERRVFAVVILVKLFRGHHHNIIYKCLDETAGPNEAECPERILKLLTETTYEYAQNWRKRCWDKIAAKKSRPSIEVGTKLRYGQFDFVVEEKLGKKGYLVHDGTRPWRLSQAQARKAIVEPELAP